MGAVNREKKRSRGSRCIADAVKKSGKVVTRWQALGTRRHVFEPTVLTDVTTDTIITKEGTFGPVAPLCCFKTDEGGLQDRSTMPPP
jgi:succinate-semialdehyde dehydrogenase / glutarate-semialdehyde dehydrogenase